MNGATQVRQTFLRDMTAINRRAAALSARIVDEARRTAKEAGIDPSMPFHIAHNAMCGLHYGRPWVGVDYALCRKVLWLEKQSWEPRRLADCIYRRAFNRMIDATNGCEPRYTEVSE